MQELKINNLEIQYNGIDEIKLSFFLEISIKKKLWDNYGMTGT